MKSQRPQTLTQQLRHFVETSGQTRYEIAEATGIGESSLCRLVKGDRFISPKALDILADYLGLTITLKQKPGRKRPGRKQAKG
jgi:transcriptional regulator with XRE-family HTH domain